MKYYDLASALTYIDSSIHIPLGFFFYQGFLSQTLTIHRTAEAWRDHVLFLSAKFDFVEISFLPFFIVNFGSHFTNVLRDKRWWFYSMISSRSQKENFIFHLVYVNKNLAAETWFDPNLQYLHMCYNLFISKVFPH